MLKRISAISTYYTDKNKVIEAGISTQRWERRTLKNYIALCNMILTTRSSDIWIKTKSINLFSSMRFCNVFNLSVLYNNIGSERDNMVARGACFTVTWVSLEIITRRNVPVWTRIKSFLGFHRPTHCTVVSWLTLIAALASQWQCGGGL